MFSTCCLLAYVGPGLGLGTIAVVLGFLASLLLALFAAVWYPVKRLVRAMKRNDAASEPVAAPADGAAE